MVLHEWHLRDQPSASTLSGPIETEDHVNVVVYILRPQPQLALGNPTTTTGRNRVYPYGSYHSGTCLHSSLVLLTYTVHARASSSRRIVE